MDFNTAFQRVPSGNIYKRGVQTEKVVLDNYYQKLVDVWHKHTSTVIEGWEKDVLDMLDQQDSDCILMVVVPPKESLDNLTSFIESMRAGAYISETPIHQDDTLGDYDGQKYVAVYADEVPILNYSVLCKLKLHCDKIVVFLTAEPDVARMRGVMGIDDYYCRVVNLKMKRGRTVLDLKSKRDVPDFENGE